MTLAGPRPERPELQKEIEKEVPEFGLRLQAKAGLTGYAQVYGNECRFTGNPGWGSEPWLIQIENHVLLSSDIKFITHDAATFLFRDTEA